MACLGHRKCPNPDCNGHVFIVIINGKLLLTYPPELIDFDKNGIPENIIKLLEETLICHSNKCYTAAGMMVRRTLEEICEENGAKGNNLKARIESFKDKILVPPDLIKGMSNIRLLGNDAAHVEIKGFENVGKAEVEIVIEFTKEILKALYHYKDLLAKFNGLNKQDNTQ